MAPFVPIRENSSGMCGTGLDDIKGNSKLSLTSKGNVDATLPNKRISQGSKGSGKGPGPAPPPRTSTGSRQSPSIRLKTAGGQEEVLAKRKEQAEGSSTTMEDVRRSQGSRTSKGSGKGTAPGAAPKAGEKPPSKDTTTVNLKTREGPLATVPEEHKRVSSYHYVDEPMEQICLTDDIDQEEENSWRNAIYLGGIGGATMADALEVRNIKLVISILEEKAPAPEPQCPGVVYWRSPSVGVEETADNAKALAALLVQIHGKMDETLKSGSSVLVHCHTGVCRSPAVVIAYVMKQRKVSAQEALQHVRQFRRIVSPGVPLMEMLSSLPGGKRVSKSGPSGPPPPPRGDVPKRNDASIKMKVRDEGAALAAVPDDQKRHSPIVHVDEPMNHICLSSNPTEELDTQWRNALYLGGADGATMADALEIRNVKLVISVLHAEAPSVAPQVAGVEYWRSPPLAEDTSTYEAGQALAAMMDEVHGKIDATLAAGNSVLVHCAAGVSRSASVVIGYVIRKLGVGPSDARDLVRHYRRVVSPGPAFMNALLGFAVTKQLLPKGRGKGTAPGQAPPPRGDVQKRDTPSIKLKVREGEELKPVPAAAAATVAA